MTGRNNIPLVSVCFSAYNHENYVTEAIHSVIDQNYPNIELIIINDGSKDGTWEKMLIMKEACKKRFASVVFENQENKGTCININRMIEISNGKYISLMASDDAIAPDFVETTLGFLENHDNYGMVVVDSSCMNDKSKTIAYKRKYQTSGAYLRSKKKNPDFLSDDFGTYETLLKSNYLPQGNLFRAKLIKQIKLTPEAPLEDWYINLQMSKITKIKYIDLPLYRYRLHEKNTVKNKKQLREYINKTMKYEIELIKQAKDIQLLDKVQGLLTDEKNIFHIPRILRLFRRKYLGDKKFFLSVFGKTVWCLEKKIKDHKK